MDGSLKTRGYGKIKTGISRWIILGGLILGMATGSGLPYASAAPAPESFSGLAKELSPTVVNVKMTKVQQLSGPQWQSMPGNPFGDRFENFFRGMPQTPPQRRMEGAGSGVIIQPDGYILTNNHVVENASEVTVTLSDKKEYKAKIVGRDPKTDLALLKIDVDTPLHAVSMGDSDRLEVGDWVMAVGNPFGLGHTVTSGIVSAKGRVIGQGPYDDFIQTDAAINPGNSGGPLFNLKGELVGINTAIIPNGQGIGFAIPINTAKPLIPQLEKNGQVTRGYLGVGIQSVTPDLDGALGLNGRKGALVTEVTPGGPAEKGGVRKGDLIVLFDNKKIEDARDLSIKVAQSPVGEEVSLSVVRDGEERPLTVRLGKLKGDESASENSPQPARGKWGLWLQDTDADTAQRFGMGESSGAVVTKVEPDSPADEGGVREGDLILEVDRKPVNSAREAKEAMSKASDNLLLLVKREGGSLFIPLKAA